MANGKCQTTQLWLAVLSGRFLPLESVSMEIEREFRNIQTGNHPTSHIKTIKPECVTGSMETHRDPLLQQRERVEYLFLCNKKERYTIKNPIIHRKLTKNIENKYIIKFTGTEVTILKR